MRETITDLFIQQPTRAPLLSPEEAEALARAVRRYRKEGDAVFDLPAYRVPWRSLVPWERQKRLQKLRLAIRRGEAIEEAAEAIGVPEAVAVKEMGKERNG